MKGKRVILALPKSALTVYWNRALEQAGLKVSDVEQVYDGATPNRYAALVSGTVQAAGVVPAHTARDDLVGQGHAEKLDHRHREVSGQWVALHVEPGRVQEDTRRDMAAVVQPQRHREPAGRVGAEHDPVSPHALGRGVEWAVRVRSPPPALHALLRHSRLERARTVNSMIEVCTAMTDITPLRDFVIATTDILDPIGGDEPALIEAIRPRLAALIATDGSLPKN